MCIEFVDRPGEGGVSDTPGRSRSLGVLDQYTSVCEKPCMFLFPQPENHEWSLDGAGEVLGRIAIESDLEAIQLCYGLKLWDAKFLMCLSKDEEIIGECHLEAMLGAIF